jgi:hypothetical protein
VTPLFPRVHVAALVGRHSSRTAGRNGLSKGTYRFVNKLRLVSNRENKSFSRFICK